jgi:(E)-4-hydroxy-3-methylbut-2-enyl-diphosphate synthase
VNEQTPIRRRESRQIHVGQVAVGGGAPISVQSMCNTDTRDVNATVAQVNALQGAGAEIVRLAVPDDDAARALREIVRRTSAPLIADIHFDYKLALASIDAGVAGLRLNPGNIGSIERVREVVRACEPRLLPIRIGVNAGSLEKRLLREFGGPTPEAMAQSALDHVKILEDMGYGAIKVSIKASDVPRTIAANRLFAERSDLPLHLGITEAGTAWTGAIRSAVGLGVLLAEGIGDTIRVSLTGDPLPEVKAGWEILKCLGIRQRGITITSCPNCGRLEQPIEGVIDELEKEFGALLAPVHLAVMGCSVNGPGESREADLGVIAARDGYLLYKAGKFWKKVSRAENTPSLREALKELPKE